jgi:hypothetical protein
VRKIFVFAVGILFLFVLNFSFPKAYASDSSRTEITNKKYIAVTVTDQDGKVINVPACARLAADGKSCAMVTTAIGDIDTNGPAFVQRIFSFVLGIGGGIALILIILAGYKFITSQGNPEKVKAANEQLTSAIVGLLFIILSFVILQIIGVDILKIPGFS